MACGMACTTSVEATSSISRFRISTSVPKSSVASPCFLFPLKDGGLLAGGFGRDAVMCTREGETEVEATISTSYSEEDEEEVEELVEEEADLALPGRKSLHWREKPDL